MLKVFIGILGVSLFFIGCTEKTKPALLRPISQPISEERLTETPPRETRIVLDGSGSSVTFTRITDPQILSRLGSIVWQDPNGLIWGDTLLLENGNVREMIWQDAFHHCLHLNPETERERIRTRLFEGERPNHGYFLPRKEEYMELRVALGGAPGAEEFHRPPGYRQEVLPHLNFWFWTSSINSEATRNAYYFSGTSGFINHDHRTVNYAVRCVLLQY